MVGDALGDVEKPVRNTTTVDKGEDFCSFKITEFAKFVSVLNLCVLSLHMDNANLICIVPI